LQWEVLFLGVTVAVVGVTLVGATLVGATLVGVTVVGVTVAVAVAVAVFVSAVVLCLKEPEQWKQRGLQGVVEIKTSKE